MGTFNINYLFGALSGVQPPAPLIPPVPPPTPTVPIAPPPSPVPTLPLPPGPSRVVEPASVVGEQLTASVIGSDFWMPSVSDLQASQTDPSARITRGVRLNTVIGANDQTSAWIELGDFAGNFGTATTSQQWNGHYFAWHGTDGTYGEMTAGSDPTTNWHEFRISPTGLVWDIAIDNAVVGYVQDSDASQPGVRTDASIRTGNIADDAFVNGTMVGYLQYQDPTGNWNFWPSAVEYSSAYPIASANFDPNSYNVTFSSAVPNTAAAIGQRRGAARSASPLSLRRAPGPGASVLPKHVLAANEGRRSEFLSRRGLAFQRLLIGSTVNRVSQVKLVPYGDVVELRGFRSNQIAPGRLVWAAVIECPRGVQTDIGRFGSGTRVLNLIDAATGRLLGFEVLGQFDRGKQLGAFLFGRHN